MCAFLALDLDYGLDAIMYLFGLHYWLDRVTWLDLEEGGGVMIFKSLDWCN